MNSALKKGLKLLFKPLDFSIGASVNGQRFRMPIIKGQSGGYHALSEPWMTDTLRRLIKMIPGTAFMDVGVNMGQTLVKIKSLDRRISYVGFEPNPFCVQYVKRVIQENQFPDCTLVPVGLSDSPSVVSIFSASAGDPAATIVAQLRQGQDRSFRQHVPVFAFDQLPPDLVQKNISVVKIDVEGAESLVLSGMRQFLKEKQPWIICEVLHADSPAQLTAAAERNARMMTLLGECGYFVCRLVKAEGGSALRGLEVVDKFSEGVWQDPLSFQLCDYLLVPESARQKTLSAFGEARSGS